MSQPTNTFDINLLEQSDTAIYFTWTKTGDTCRVIRDETVIYTGTHNAVKDENLERGEFYTYTIERLDQEEKVVDRIKMQTGTENKEHNHLNRLQAITVTAIVSENRISLAWGEIQGVEEYEIYREGELVDTVTATQYTDRNVPMDQSYTFWIRCKRPLPDSEENFGEEKFIAARLFGLFNRRPSRSEPAMEDFWLTKKIGRLDRLLVDRHQAQDRPQFSKWYFRYMTFLPDRIIQNPNMLSPNRYFSGDDRSFDPEAKRYRTQVEFSIELNDKSAICEFHKDIGTSVAYNWRRKFRKADVASTEGIHFEEVRENDRTATVFYTHKVGNPITTAPDISYEVSAVFYHNGTYDISGIHDQSPNHEVYLKDGASEEWEMIHEAESKGLAWMAGPIARQYWRISNFE
ncbi:DUF3238 domain-containing protein [Planococcus salinus]|uniref:DUF3238 domain-containing protein n=1 Tax=Planococcus salinus TaxID=1848460 RepID=A0A3M8P4W6_9BACL|nr:DUF3238 domain-containing protein [Planococcus salinus]RNF38707.1 DUF3238 domain-containing protein [Planococcus salinus]